MNYPTAEEVRAAVQATQPLNVAVTVTESSHGINGPVYAVAFVAIEVPSAV